MTHRSYFFEMFTLGTEHLSPRKLEIISKIRVDLRQSGVTESVVFPDLDGLGREIKQVWGDRK